MAVNSHSFPSQITHSYLDDTISGEILRNYTARIYETIHAAETIVTPSGAQLSSGVFSC